MAKAKKGDKLSCEVCDLVVVVDEACGCASAALFCCGKPMAKGKPAVAKAGKKAAPAAAKPVKAAGAAKTTVAAKKAPAKAVAVKPKPKAVAAKAAPKKPPAPKK